VHRGRVVVVWVHSRVDRSLFGLAAGVTVRRRCLSHGGGVVGLVLLCSVLKERAASPVSWCRPFGVGGGVAGVVCVLLLFLENSIASTSIFSVSKL
jgi:hypothetical protein